MVWCGVFFFEQITPPTHTQHKGSLSTGGFPKNGNMFFDVPHVPPQCKLRTEDGRTVRVQETSLYEALELWHRFCDPNCLGLDLCTGTGVSIMAMLHLGLQGIVNERDAPALALGEARARNYMDHLYKQNSYKYPELGACHIQAHDGTDLYAWIGLALKYSKAQKRNYSAGSTVMILPVSNMPYNLNAKITANDWQQVLAVGLVSSYVLGALLMY